MMNSSESTVILSLLVAGGSAAVGQLGQGHIPPVRIGVGVAVAGTLLLVVAQFAPQVAASFAVIVMITALLVSGGPAFLALTNATTKGK